MSTSSTGSSTSSTLTFNGSSTYSSSFQQVLNRAVDLASLPMQTLQGDVTTLQSKQSALTSLGTTFTALETSLTNISTAAGGSPSATSSSSAVTAATTSAAMPGAYQIQVDSLGSNTTTFSDAGNTVTDPTTGNISSATSFTLTINGTATTITPAGTSLDSLATAINNSGQKVQATVVNLGSNASPDYRLSVTSKDLAPDAIQLSDGTKNLLQTLSTGSNATYQVAGQSTVLSSSSNEVTLSSGLTVTMNAVTTSPVTVTVTQSSSGLETALSDFVSAYNASFAALGAQRGQSGGALTGDSLIFDMGSMLSNMVDYKGPSGTGVSSLADLGITINSDGTLTFSSSTFESASSSAIQSFLGSTTSSGWLQQSYNAVDTFANSATGQIGSEYNTVGSEITADQSKIADDQAQISTLTTNLESQLSAADAAIATLQSTNSYMEQLFTATYGSSNTSAASS